MKEFASQAKLMDVKTHGQTVGTNYNISDFFFSKIALISIMKKYESTKKVGHCGGRTHDIRVSRRSNVLRHMRLIFMRIILTSGDS